VQVLIDPTRARGRACGRHGRRVRVGRVLRVHAVATAADARVRGYGEALSWAATLFRPDLPATLQASDMGLPIYRRMGYEVFGDFTVWEGPRPRTAD
jgi:hypothetical protein